MPEPKDIKGLYFFSSGTEVGCPKLNSGNTCWFSVSMLSSVFMYFDLFLQNFNHQQVSVKE